MVNLQIYGHMKKPMQNLMKPIDRRETYIKVPVNSYTVLFVLFLVTLLTLTGNWFFGKYRLRSPIVVKIQAPFEDRIASKLPSGIQKVNAEEMNLKPAVTTTPSPEPTKKPEKQADLPSSGSRATVPIAEGIAYIKSTYASLGENEVKVAIAISKSENAVNQHPDYFDCQIEHTNNDGSVDLGSMQINSRNWPKFGGEENLKDCFKNWDAGYSMRTSWGNWTAWSSHNNGSYLQFMND